MNTILHRLEQLKAISSVVREARSHLPDIPLERIMRYLPHARTTTHWPAVALGFGSGVAVGAGAALLFAPMNGVELRRRIEEKLSAIRTADPQGAADEPAAADEQASGDLQDLSQKALYERAQAEAIPGRSSMSKEELIEALEH
jgi:gas vesicle protein